MLNYWIYLNKRNNYSNIRSYILYNIMLKYRTLHRHMLIMTILNSTYLYFLF